MPEITEDEKALDLPKGWEWVRLGNLTGFQNGCYFKSDEMRGNDLGIVRIGDIQNGEIVETKMKLISQALASEIRPEYIINKGDIVIAMSGATAGKIGQNKNKKQYALNQRVGKFIFPPSVNREYIFRYIELNRDTLLTISNGSIIDNLSTEQINNFVLAYPSEEEQKTILEKVNQLMSWCDELEKKQKSENFCMNKSCTRW